MNVASCRRFRRPAQCWQLNWRALGKQYLKQETSFGSTTEYSPNFSLSSVWLRFFFYFGRTAGPMNSKSKGWGRKRFRNGLTPWCPTNCFICHFKPFKNNQRNRRKKTWNGLTGQFQCITVLRKTYSWNPYRFSMIWKFKKVVVFLNSGTRADHQVTGQAN